MHGFEAPAGSNSLQGHLIPDKRGVIERAVMGSSYNPVLIHPRESEGHKLDFLFPLLTSTVCTALHCTVNVKQLEVRSALRP